MALNMKLMSITAASLLTMALILYVVSNAVPIWSKFGNAVIVEARYGLWRYCASSSPGNICYDPCPMKSYKSNSCPKIIAARVFVTLACILSGISALCLYACAVKRDNTNRTLLLAGKGLVFVCLVMGIIGVAAGISGTIGDRSLIKFDLGVAAIIGIVAVIFNLVGAIASLLIK